MKTTIDYSLYLVTNQQVMTSRTLVEGVEAAIQGGCTIVQLREKTMGSLAFFETAIAIKKITDRYQIPLIINDRVDIALAVDAAGVHLGQNDLPITTARKLLGPDKLIGISTGNIKEAQQAYAEGADYLGVGAMFETQTKDDAKVTPREELIRISQEIPLPIVAIGGINQNRIAYFSEIAIDGLAVVSAILGAKNIEEAAKELKEIWEQRENK